MIVTPVIQRHIDRITLPSPFSFIVQRPCPRKEVTVLMKTARHDPIARIERLFNAISMMNVDIDV